MVPKNAEAATYQPTDVRLRLGTYVPSTGGQYKADNLIQVGKEVGSVTIQAEMTLVTPASLTFGTDYFDMNTSSGGQGGLPITGIGAGLDDMGQGAAAGAASCKDAEIWVFALKSNYKYTTCSFKDHGDITSGTLTANSPRRVNITVNLNNYAGLNRGNITSTQRIIIYPYVTFDRAATGRLMAFPSGGFPVFVRFYNNQNEAVAAINGNQRPTDAPAYEGGTESIAEANPTGSVIIGFLNQIIGLLLGFLQEVIYFVFYWVLAPIIQAMLSIRTYTDSFAGVIYPGWEVIRNMSNILFIVALIAIGMATLFRIESYQFKHLLVQLIIAALLVNFSLVMAQAVLGVADTVQSQFLPNNVEVVRSLAKDLMVPYRSQIVNLDYASRGYFAVTVQQLFWLALSLGSFCVFAAIAVFLVIRIVMLWILLMTSPIAYIAGVLPQTQHYRQVWWDNFIKYAFFTPIMAFFLNMTALMVGMQKNNPVLKQIMSNPESMGAGNFTSFVMSVTSNILLLVFLLVALKVADSFGIFGAHAITSMAQKGIYAPFAAAGAGIGLAGKAYSKWAARNAYQAKLENKPVKQALWNVAQMMHPTVLKKGWEAYKHEKDMDSFDPGAGDVRDFLNRYVPSNYHWEFKHGFPVKALGQKTDYGKVARTNVTAHKASELEKAPLSEEQKVDFALGLHHAGDIAAMQYIIMDGRHEDGYMISWWEKQLEEEKQNQLAKLHAEHPDWDQKKLEKEADDEARKLIMPYYDPIEYVDVISHEMGHGGMTKEQIATELTYLTEKAEATNKERGYGYSLTDWDGTSRAINDFEGYKLYEQKYGSGELLNKLMSETNDKGVEVFERAADGTLVFKPRLFNGEKVLDKDGKEQEYKINNFEDFQKVMNLTHEVNWVKRKPVNEKGEFDADAKFKYHGNGVTDLRYVMMGSRKAQDAGKRLKRGNSEDKFAMMEPAVENIQVADVGYYGTNAYSMFKAPSIPRNLATKIPNMRRFQGRNMYILGLKENAEGRIILEEETTPKGEIIRPTVDYRTLAVKLASNPYIFSALLQSMGFTTKDLKVIEGQLRNPEIVKYAKGRDARIEGFKLVDGGPGGRPWVLPWYEGEPEPAGSSPKEGG